MTNSCGAFYLVKTDDSCYDIAASYVGLLGSTTATTTTTTTSGEVSTPTPTQAGMVADCTSCGDGCSDIATDNGIVLDELCLWNLALNVDCSGLWPDYYICVGYSYYYHGARGGRNTDSHPNWDGNGDSCYDIAAENGIALNTLYVWNPALNRDCSGLWPDYYLCVGM
ncbi:hypothetical protein N7507_003334 [Penicillium longicatenatum]|nr:hypothetical protein N7507_003334 [Penicillium longicatenatum]